jgi:cell division protein FtsI/penicillin-binding protein 2
VIARSRERGSHAGRPRGYGLPFAMPGLGTQPSVKPVSEPGPAGPEMPPGPEPETAPGVPDFPGAGNGGNGHSAAGTIAPAGPGGPVGPGGAPRPVGPKPPRGGGSRHRKAPERKPLISRKLRLVLIAALVVGALTVGFSTGFGSEASAEPAVQAFLLDWQQGKYAAAAALTDGSASDVTTQLAAAYTDLDATDSFFAMQSVAQHGSTAVATFKATVDLAQSSQQWIYVGQFKLAEQDGHWVIDWGPSVINPSLGAGDRLAVVTTFAQRGQIEDMDGKPLLADSPVYHIGVYPGQLANAAASATAFSNVTGLNEQQVLGQIQAAPPKAFLSLLTLDPADFGKLWPKLSKVSGLTYQDHDERLFYSTAAEVVGQIGTENAGTLRAQGVAYQPGMTVGLSGLEQTYQDSLAGTPRTQVVVVNAAGRGVATLWSSTGQAGAPVRTTLNVHDEATAAHALAAQSSSAEIIALDWRTGQIRALASRDTGSLSLPSGGTLDAKVAPGMAFSIVSAAALLSNGVGVNHPLPCEPVANIGGVTFTYQPKTSTTGTLAADFADGCGTAFANMSTTLTPQQLTAAERAFGIGAPWNLKVQAFSGQAPAVSDEADVAAQATGAGGVLVSPLGMATIAAEVAAGTGHSPTLLPTDSSADWQAPVSGTALSALRNLMRLAVKSGSAHAADVPGLPVYGQAGVVQSAAHSYLSWFVGYRGDVAVAVLETGSTPQQAAAALAGTFLKSAH